MAINGGCVRVWGVVNERKQEKGGVKRVRCRVTGERRGEGFSSVLLLLSSQRQLFQPPAAAFPVCACACVRVCVCATEVLDRVNWTLIRIRNNYLSRKIAECHGTELRPIQVPCSYV